MAHVVHFFVCALQLEGLVKALSSKLLCRELLELSIELWRFYRSITKYYSLCPKMIFRAGNRIVHGLSESGGGLGTCSVTS